MEPPALAARVLFRFIHGALYLPIYEAVKHGLADAKAPIVLAVTAAATAATVVTSAIEACHRSSFHFIPASLLANTRTAPTRRRQPPL